MRINSLYVHFLKISDFLISGSVQDHKDSVDNFLFKLVLFPGRVCITSSKTNYGPRDLVH